MPEIKKLNLANIKNITKDERIKIINNESDIAKLQQLAIEFKRLEGLNLGMLQHYERIKGEISQLKQALVVVARQIPEVVNTELAIDREITNPKAKLDAICDDLNSGRMPLYRYRELLFENYSSIDDKSCMTFLAYAALKLDDQVFKNVLVSIGNFIGIDQFEYYLNLPNKIAGSEQYLNIFELYLDDYGSSNIHERKNISTAKKESLKKIAREYGKMYLQTDIDTHLSSIHLSSNESHIRALREFIEQNKIKGLKAKCKKSGFEGVDCREIKIEKRGELDAVLNEKIADLKNRLKNLQELSNEEIHKQYLNSEAKDQELNKKIKFFKQQVATAIRNLENDYITKNKDGSFVEEGVNSGFSRKEMVVVSYYFCFEGKELINERFVGLIDVLYTTQRQYNIEHGEDNPELFKIDETYLDNQVCPSGAVNQFTEKFSKFLPKVYQVKFITFDTIFIQAKQIYENSLTSIESFLENDLTVEDAFSWNLNFTMPDKVKEKIIEASKDGSEELRKICLGYIGDDPLKDAMEGALSNLKMPKFLENKINSANIKDEQIINLILNDKLPLLRVNKDSYSYDYMLSFLIRKNPSLQKAIGSKIKGLFNDDEYFKFITYIAKAEYNAEFSETEIVKKIIKSNFILNLKVCDVKSLSVFEFKEFYSSLTNTYIKTNVGSPIIFLSTSEALINNCVSNNLPNLLQLAIKLGMDFTVEISEQGGNLLVEACSKNYSDIALQLLKIGENIEKIDAELRQLPIRYAAQHHDLKLLEALINAKANYKNQLLLGIATSTKGGAKTLEFLLKYIKDEIEEKNSIGDTPLLNAVQIGDLKAIEVLIKHGADPHAVNNEGKTIFDYLVAKGDNNESFYFPNLEALLLCLDAEKTDISKLEFLNFEKFPAMKAFMILEAAKHKKNNLLRKLIDSGCSIDDEIGNNEYGQKLIHILCADAKFEVVKNFVDNFIDSPKDYLNNCKDKDINTALHYAIENKEIYDFLVEKGADINVENTLGVTPCNAIKTFEIIGFIKNRDAESLRALKNYENLEGVFNIVIHECFKLNDLEGIECFLEEVDITIGAAYLKKAATMGSKALAKIFLKHGAEIDESFSVEEINFVLGIVNENLNYSNVFKYTGFYDVVHYAFCRFFNFIGMQNEPKLKCVGSSTSWCDSGIELQSSSAVPSMSIICACSIHILGSACVLYNFFQSGQSSQAKGF